MRKIIFLILLIINITGASGQAMKTLFTNIPDSLIPQLEQAWRKDLIDLFASGKEARLKNTMGGTSTLLNITDDYLKLRATERTTVEMKQLPLINNTFIVCMTVTVDGPAPDSRIDFYTTGWQSLNRSDLMPAVSREMFVRDDADRTGDRFLDAMAMLDMNLFTYRLNPDNCNILVDYTTPLYLTSTDRDRVSSFLKTEGKTFVWNRSHFQ